MEIIGLESLQRLSIQHFTIPPASAMVQASIANRCKYGNKPCFNERAIKRSGELHSLCQFHRAMANRNQRRSELKRRNQREMERFQPYLPCPTRGVRMTHTYASTICLPSASCDDLLHNDDQMSFVKLPASQSEDNGSYFVELSATLDEKEVEYVLSALADHSWL